MPLKECPKCLEEIKNKASVCPHCLTPQDWFERYVIKSNLINSIGFALLFLFIYLDFESDSNIYDPQSVEISILSHSILDTTKGKKITVFSKVKNVSANTLHQFYFDVEIFSKSGELKEAFSDSVYGLSLRPNQEKIIELSRSMVSYEENEYDFSVLLSRADTKL